MNTFADELAIDPNALDIEWLEQPKRYYDVAEQAAEAKREVDRAKLALEVTEAELDNKIRTNPQQYGMAKVTENGLKAALKMTEEYQKACTDLNDAQYNNNMLQSATKAWEQRKAALESLVYLHGQSYFAGPSVPHQLKSNDTKEERKKRIRSRNKDED